MVRKQRFGYGYERSCAAASVGCSFSPLRKAVSRATVLADILGRRLRASRRGKPLICSASAIKILLFRAMAEYNPRQATLFCSDQERGAFTLGGRRALPQPSGTSGDYSAGTHRLFDRFTGPLDTLLALARVLFGEAEPDTATVYRPVRFDLYSVADARDRISRRLDDLPAGGPLERFLPDPDARSMDRSACGRRRTIGPPTPLGVVQHLCRQPEVGAAGRRGYGTGGRLSADSPRIGVVSPRRIGVEAA